MTNTNQAITVPFHGSSLFVVEYNAQPFTPMKPIVEGMGMSWQPQLRKLSENSKRWGITKMVTPTNGDLQEMVCLPLRKLAGWLMSIHPNKVRKEIRETVITYQNECDDVLWEYWAGQGKVTRQSNALPQNQRLLIHLENGKITHTINAEGMSLIPTKHVNKLRENMSLLSKQLGILTGDVGENMLNVQLKEVSDTTLN